MSLSESLFRLQQYDSTLDQATSRIAEIDLILADQKLIDQASQALDQAQSVFDEKRSLLKGAEHQVQLQNQKLDQNQKRLYSGAVTNPKELEDLQQESASLKKYLEVLEDRQLEAMLESDTAQNSYQAARSHLETLKKDKEAQDQQLSLEKEELIGTIAKVDAEKGSYLNNTDLPELDSYAELRVSMGGIAVSLMKADSCLSCGSNIPSAIAQEARSPTKIAHCPTCRRILHPE